MTYINYLFTRFTRLIVHSRISKSAPQCTAVTQIYTHIHETRPRNIFPRNQIPKHNRPGPAGRLAGRSSRVRCSFVSVAARLKSGTLSVVVISRIYTGAAVLCREHWTCTDENVSREIPTDPTAGGDGSRSVSLFWLSLVGARALLWRQHRRERYTV